MKKALSVVMSVVLGASLVGCNNSEEEVKDATAEQVASQVEEAKADAQAKVDELKADAEAKVDELKAGAEVKAEELKAKAEELKVDAEAGVAAVTAAAAAKVDEAKAEVEAATDELIGKTKMDQAEEMASITGSVAYRERIALPDNAVVIVTLQDISLADAPAKVIAKHRFETDGAQVPFDFDLAYDSAKIEARHRYSVSARIEVDGKLRFITDTSYPVVTDEAKTDNVNLRLIGVRQ